MSAARVEYRGGAFGRRIVSRSWFLWVALAGVSAASAANPSREPAGTLHPEGRGPIPYYVNDSGHDGPTVMIIGGVHGDEAAGAAAANQIRSWPVTNGKLIVIPTANPEALAADSRTTPKVGKAVANLNRNFPSTRPEDEPQGTQATAIWEFVKQQRPTWLLDLHEGFDASQAGTGSVGSSLIVYPSDEALAAAKLMLDAINATISEPKQQFIQRKSPIGGSLARAAAVQLGARTMIVETAKRGQPVSLRTRQQRIMVHCFLRHLGMIDASVTPELMTPQARSADDIFVALYDSAGVGGKGVPRMLEIGAHTRGMHVERVGPADISAGVLKQFDLVVFSGGSGSGQGKALAETGRAAVKRYVDQGGGYIGICAGSYLACSGFSWGLGILDARTKSPLWKRGKGTVKFAATDSGHELLGLKPADTDVLYANGPILEPAHQDDIPDFTALATFVTELAKNDTPKGLMVNSPAVVAGHFGQGRVICFSPHPEQTQGLDGCVVRAVRWVARSRHAN